MTKRKPEKRVMSEDERTYREDFELVDTAKIDPSDLENYMRRFPRLSRASLK